MATAKTTITDPRTAVESARTFLAETRLAVAEHLEQGRRNEERSRSGDLTLTGLEVATWEADRKILADRLAAAERRLKTAELALPAEETRLADVLASVLGQVLGEVPVIVSNVKPDPTTVELPVCYVVQGKPTVEEIRRGLISGKVECLYFRPAWATKLNADALERLAAEAGIACRTQDHTQTDASHLLDVLTVDVEYAFEELPVIDANNDGGTTLTNLHRWVPRDIVASSQMTGARWDGRQVLTPTIKAEADPAKLKSDTTDKEASASAS